MNFESWGVGRVEFVSFTGLVLGGVDWGGVCFSSLIGRCLIKCRGEFWAGYVCEVVLGMWDGC